MNPTGNESAPLPCAPRRTIEVATGGARLACELRGKDIEVVLLHAGVADRRSWFSTMDHLADRFGSAAYDRRGFGDSRYRAEPYSQTRDLVAVLDALGCRRAVLVGNSQGGRIAIDFALEHPSRVRGLYLVAPAVSGAQEPESDSPGTERIGAAIEVAEQAEDVEAANELEAQLWLDGPESVAGRVAGPARELFLLMNGRALIADDPGEASEPPSALDRLGELSMPVEVLLGELDLECITSQGIEIAAAVARGHHRVLAGRAHLPQLEDGQAFASGLRQFLASLED